MIIVISMDSPRRVHNVLTPLCDKGNLWEQEEGGGGWGGTPAQCGE